MCSDVFRMLKSKTRWCSGELPPKFSEGEGGASKTKNEHSGRNDSGVRKTKIFSHINSKPYNLVYLPLVCFPRKLTDP